MSVNCEHCGRYRNPRVEHCRGCCNKETRKDVKELRKHKKAGRTNSNTHSLSRPAFHVFGRCTFCNCKYYVQRGGLCRYCAYNVKRKNACKNKGWGSWFCEWLAGN